MHFKSITLTFTCAMATSLMASPLAARNSAENYIELYREATSTNGSLVYYGPASGTQKPRSEVLEVEERASCRTNAPPVCSTDHTARNDICDQLVTELQANSQIAVGESPRQICYEGSAASSNEYCCVSWHNVVPNLIKGNLAGYATTILATCTTNGISGEIRNVLVSRTCTTVCLSNRGTGC